MFMYKFFLITIFLVVVNNDFIIYIDFARITASNCTATDDFTNSVKYGMYSMNL